MKRFYCFLAVLMVVGISSLSATTNIPAYRAPESSMIAIERTHVPLPLPPTAHVPGVPVPPVSHVPGMPTPTCGGPLPACPPGLLSTNNKLTSSN